MAYNPTTAANHDISVKQLHDSLSQVITKYEAAISAAIAALPAEMFLNHTKTAFVASFAWSASTYPSSTNPNLEGKPVLVFGIDTKDNVSGAVTTTYSFMDMSALVDTYTTAAGVTSQALTINGYVITLNIDPDTNNHFSVTANGVMVDVSDKADKDTDAVTGNIAIFDANGNPVDSGRTFATDSEITEMLADLYPSA